MQKFQRIANSYHRRCPKNENERLLDAYRSGCFDAETIVEAGRATLDSKHFDMLLRSLGRRTKVRKKSLPDINVAICYLHDTGVLRHLSAKEGAKRVTKFLRDHGISDGLSDTGYQKRLERLRRLGLIDTD